MASSAAQDRAARAAQANVAPVQSVRAELAHHSVAAHGLGQVALGPADLAVHRAAVQDQRVPTALPHVDHVRQDPAGLPAHLGHAQTGRHGARVDRPIRANSLSRSISRGGR